jgi:DNA-binding NarL/FixJ family response regulator
MVFPPVPPMAGRPASGGAHSSLVRRLSPAHTHANPTALGVWVVDADAAFRGALACVLNHVHGICCPATFALAGEALAALDDLPHPDILVLEASARHHPVQAARVKVRAPAVQVIVLYAEEDAEGMEAALCAGASACVPRHVLPNTLLAVIGEVRRGALLVPPAVRARVHSLLVEGAMPRRVEPPDLRVAFGLTEQEERVAWLLAERLANAEVADRLCLSPHTARHHTERVLAKLGVSRRGEVAARLASVAERTAIGCGSTRG